MRMQGYFLFYSAEKKPVKPTGGMPTEKLKDAGRSQVASKEQHLIKKKKPVGKN